jgi:UTP--glucose-1-phosphate uridylyltransferase
MDIIKAVIPAAGLGTRFLPATKAVPKEMLPILNKPAIQYIIEEGIASRINQFLIITSREKAAIANHFDYAPELEQLLKQTNKQDKVAALDKIISAAHFSYIRQPEPLGLGHAVLMARYSIGKEYFGIFLPDDLIIHDTPALAQLIAIAQQERASIIAVQEVPYDMISSYGVIAIKKQITSQLFQVSHLVEKPTAKDAPSNLGIIGRYVLSHKIFDSLDAISPYAQGELQLTDAIAHMLNNNEKVFAYKIQGTRLDIGTPLGWLKANIMLGINSSEYGPALRQFLAQQ